MLIEKSGLIDYPPFIHECAVYIGKLRDLYNYDMNEEAERFKRGDRSEYVNILGVKGELIYSYFLQSKGIKHNTAKLLSNRPVSSWDIKIKGINKKIDVKTIRTDAPDLLVNKEAHLKTKDIDTYVFVQLINDETARYWVFKYEDVSNWDIKNVKYTDAYYLNIESI